MPTPTRTPEEYFKLLDYNGRMPVQHLSHAAEVILGNLLGYRNGKRREQDIIELASMLTAWSLVTLSHAE